MLWRHCRKFAPHNLIIALSRDGVDDVNLIIALSRWRVCFEIIYYRVIKGLRVCQDYCVRQAANHTICFAYCNPLVIIILTETLKRRHVAGFSKTAERITMKLSDIMEDGYLGANIDDAMMSYIIGTPHNFPQIFFPQFFLSPKNFFPNFYPPKFLSPNFFPPNCFPLNFSPKFLTGTLLPAICSPLLKIAITLYA